MISKHQVRTGKIPWLAALFGCVFLAQSSIAEQVNSGVFRHRAEIEYAQARTVFQAATYGSPAEWQFARACFNLADFATNDTERAALAHEGIDACQQLIKAEPKSAPAHYYLAMNFGQLARTEYLGALKLVKEMEREFKTAWSLDQSLDHGGPARSLGELYREAPGWPTSIGSRRKAREWLERADHAAPGFPENLLMLTESYLKWNEPESAQKMLKALDAAWPAAQTNFTGIRWEQDWADWTARRNDAREKIKEMLGTKSAAPSHRSE